MSVLFGLRFDFRNPDIAETATADRYAAAVDMVEWADDLGCVTVAVSEHHGSPDGYLPSPLPMVAAMAARTTNVRFMVAALIAPFYDPVRLAEDLIVLDHLSRGRLDVIVAGGYVREEFAMYGAAMAERAKRVTETVAALRGAFTGEPFEHQGRTVHITPGPYQAGPGILLGGSSEAAARRAARIADGFIPSVPEVWEFYRDEVQQLGRPDPGPSPMPLENRVVALAEDADKGWEQMAPFFLHETNAYGTWQAQENVATPYRTASNGDELRTTNRYAVLTPDQLVAELKAAPFPFIFFHPMCGGIPVDLAWNSLHLFEREVMPQFA